METPAYRKDAPSSFLEAVKREMAVSIPEAVSAWQTEKTGKISW